MTDTASAIMFGVLIGLVIGISVAASISVNEWRNDTVKRGLAIYCPQDGQWAWIGECEL
jgi:hypothetical protein